MGRSAHSGPFDFMALDMAGYLTCRKRLAALDGREQGGGCGILDMRSASMVSVGMLTPPGRNLSWISRPSPGGGGPCVWCLPAGARREPQRPGGERGRGADREWSGTGPRQPFSRGAGSSR
jgi:hypothetical protein